ncbi:MAG TPA: DUF6796 family protein [Candidatus Acidoferrum sp.]|nr:DUF6796 family protein [Candidatus Acidoferrum sp.]
MTPDSSDRIRRLTGLCGLAGALLFFVGDMLFYGHFGSGANFSAGLIMTVTHASDARLYAGGLVGPFAACLCILGFWHVYLNTRASSPFLSRLILVCFSVLMVFGSAIHTLWTAHGLALKYCYAQSAPCSDLASSLKAYWSLTYNFGASFAYLGAILLLLLVLFRRTNYPRWTILFNPAILILLSQLADYIPAPLGAIFVGGSENLSIALFFLISLLSTWNTSVAISPAPGYRS